MKTKYFIFISLLFFVTLNYAQEKNTSNKLELSYDIKYLKSKYYPDEEKVLNIFAAREYLQDAR